MPGQVEAVLQLPGYLTAAKWRLSLLVCLVLTLAMPLVGGCREQVGPSPRQPQNASSQPAGSPVSLEAALRANRLGRWVYARREPQHQDNRRHRYVRIGRPDRSIEGMLVGRRFRPVDEYLAPLSGASAVPASQPAEPAPLEGGTSFMFRVARPLAPIPAELKEGEPVVDTTDIIYYEYDGRVLARGTFTRTAEIEGVEDVSCPAGEFADCLRVRVDLTLKIPWIISMDWTSWYWLSQEVGEVQRLEHMSGMFLIFLFSSTHEYELVSHHAPATMLPDLCIAPAWHTGATLLTRTAPRPQIGGMIVDYASETAPPPASAPATAPARTTPTASAVISR